MLMKLILYSPDKAWVQANHGHVMLWSASKIFINKFLQSFSIICNVSVFIPVKTIMNVCFFKGIRINIPAVRATALRTSLPPRIKIGGITKKEATKTRVIKTRAGVIRTKTEAPTS